MEKKELTTKPTRRRRPRNRRRRQQKKKDEEPSNNVVAKDLDLSDLISEANALEKQLSELQKQLKINHENMPAKDQGKRAMLIATEQIVATEEEIGYVRNSLKKTYRRLFDQDFLYATSHHIEDKIWRYIFYAEIETVRAKLRQMKPNHPNYDTVQKSFSQKIESALKFYRELNNKVKSTFHVNTQTFGIELFKLLSEDKIVGVLLQSNYICMGDLARYHAQQAMLIKNSQQASYYWSLSKSCYSKAVEVYRVSGKPYSQLALVSMSKGSAIDVVWYYCMSLAVKYPSTVGRDNLYSFYGKIRLNPALKTNITEFTAIISQFVQAFLYLHKTLMFNEGEETDTRAVSRQLSLALANASGSQHFHILRTTLSRTTHILMVSIWITSERMKDKANYGQRAVIQSCQIKMYVFVFHLFTHLYRQASEMDEALDKSIAEAILPSLSVWATFLSYNITTISQYCSTAMMDMRNREPEKKELAKAIQALLPILIAHPCFPDPVLNVLPTTYPLSEDLSLLGCAPFTQFHMHVDYFKEQPYEVEGEHTFEARKQVRWGRIREWIKKMADSNSFEFIQYNQTEQKYSIIDENAKRQQQNRFMKALATQRLMEQVSSLEKNVNRMTLSTNKQKEVTKKEIFTCVVDVTCFLDDLHKVKKWATQTLDASSRKQGSILEVIVPLEVIDDLDDCKKGTSHMNLQARESIRYLDQVLGNSNSTSSSEDHTTSFLRTQKVAEKLDDWEQAKAYWIGEESRSTKVMDELMTDEESNGGASESDLDTDSDSDSDLFKPRRYRHDEEDSELEDSSEGEESEEEEESDMSDDEKAVAEQQDVEEYAYNEEGDYEDDEYDEDIPTDYTHVPKAYRPILSCLLYYYQSKMETPDRLVLVTNDEDLAWWAELFGNVKTGKRLVIKTVDEWNRILNSFGQTYAYDPNKR
ncbi:hypothetical protein K501DRAFT_287620 [Backusella circina FSU 941]|nr:hypothetical protein K501DRAFT_287620 [Backusella circina FSU 941]